LTTTDTTDRPDIRDMAVVHRVFRREVGLLARMVRAVPAGNTARARIVAGHFADYGLILHLHHAGEDELAWPLLLARVEPEAETVLRMGAQHEALDATLDEAARRIPAWTSAPSPETAAPLADAIAAHGAALREHMDDEEAHVVPLIAEYLTAAEWERLAERFGQEAPNSKLLFFLGLMLEEASSAELAMMLGNLPAPARLLWHTIGERQYKRKIRRIRADILADERGW
jgi:Hemerythrin HHE cation binding domain